MGYSKSYLVLFCVLDLNLMAPTKFNNSFIMFN